MQCGQPLHLKTLDDEAAHARLTAAAPAALAEKLQAQAHLTGEVRQVTILFVDVVSSTALAQQFDPETWALIINGAFDRLAPAIYRYEGTIARLLGDGLWAFFGAPVAHEDDPVRAVQAALDLLATVREYAAEIQERHGVGFAMRACIHTGSVVMGRVGADLRYDFTPMGGAVNITARLKFSAEPMSVLITGDAYRFVSPLFDCSPRGEIEVKGAPSRVAVYEVLGRKAQPGRVRGLAGLESPLVGRDAELASLAGMSQAVRAGVGRAVLILGEPGLGKTRLIAEWRASELQEGHGVGSRWFEGRCLSYGRGLAYHLLIDLLRSIIGVSEAADETAARAALRALVDRLFGSGAHDELEGEALEVYASLGSLLMLRLEAQALELATRLDPQAYQAQLLTALRQLLLALAGRTPLTLVLEDIHWADPSSVELLIRLLPVLSAGPILLCLAARPEPEAPGWRLVAAARESLGQRLTELSLAPLSDADGRQMVANLLRLEALPEFVRQTILSKAEGNPLFVEEVIRMLIDRRAIVQRGSQWVAAESIGEVEIPDNLQGLLLARVDRLPDEARRTLRVAAVIGRQFPVRVLQTVLGGGDRL